MAERVRWTKQKRRLSLLPIERPKQEVEGWVSSEAGKRSEETAV